MYLEYALLQQILIFYSNSATFYRTAKGEEMELVLEYGQKRIGIECKVTVSPEITRSMTISINDLKPDHVFIVAPVNDSYPLSQDVTVISLSNMFNHPIIADFTC